MARNISSASAKRVANVDDDSGRCGACVGIVLLCGNGGAHEIEPEQHALTVGHVADEASHGQGELLDERRGGDDLLPPGEDRLLIDVDHVELVAALEVLLAHPLQGLYRLRCSTRHAGYVQSEDIPL